MKKRVIFLMMTGMLCVSMLAGCHKKKEESTVTESVQESVTEESTLDSEEESQMLPEMKVITDAMKKTTDQNAFSMGSGVDVSLSGSLVNEDIHIQTDIDVLRESESGGMEMTMRTTSDLDDVVTTGGYKDGIYYMSVGDEKTTQEKSEEDVLNSISDITDLVYEAAENVESVDTKQEAGETVYTYEIPTYLAKSYIKKTVESLNIEDLDKVYIDVEEAEFVTTVDDDGYVSCQKAVLTGEVSALVFSIPVEVDVDADFTHLDQTELDVETW